jgi:hypothetical protein
MNGNASSRRHFLRRSAAAAASLGAFAAPWIHHLARANHAHGEDPPARKTKIVLIGHKPDHPPGTHLYLPDSRLLAKCLRQTPGVEAIVSDGWPKDPAVLEGVNAIALYTSPGAEILFTGPHAGQAEKLFKQGVGLTAIHWATGIRDNKNEKLAAQYLGHLGGLFGLPGSGIDFSTSKVEQLDPKHPVCRGCSEHELKDEWYLNLKFLPAAKPLLKVRVKEKDQVVAWVYERPDSGGGRSFGSTLAHYHDNFAIESFRRFLVNGILWTAHCEIPAGGAPCKVTAEDLRLPEAAK